MLATSPAWDQTFSNLIAAHKLQRWPSPVQLLRMQQRLLQLPLILTTMGLLCSVLGILLVKIMSAKDPASALRIGTIGSAVIFIVGAFGLCNSLGVSSNIAAAVLCGAVGGIIIGLVT